VRHGYLTQCRDDGGGVMAQEDLGEAAAAERAEIDVHDLPR
jgi:hypothetical protein